jgi:hypothetical protein
MPPGQRQEALNVLLAELLHERGVVAAPETLHQAGPQKVRLMPDVLVEYRGLRTALEGEVEAPNAREKALHSATRRVESGLAQIGVGVVYPAHLRDIEFALLKDEIAHAQLQIAVVSEAGTTGFVSGDIDDLERALRSTFEQLLQEDVVAEVVAILDEAVDRYMDALWPTPGNWGRVMYALYGRIPDEDFDRMTEIERAANLRIAGLIMINAMIFHQVLSDTNKNVTSLEVLREKDDTHKLGDQWGYILKEINYFSIFHLARELLLAVSGRAGVDAFRATSAAALAIADKRAALHHDLMGRVYHRLLTDAKFLGTYYTSIPAATLLLKLALRPAGWQVEWDKPEKIGELRVGDLACGTGTLLMAAADTLLDNYISAAASQGKQVNLKTIHQQIAESVLHGYDVLASAIHLTASTLALRNAHVPLKKMNLYVLPLGGVDNRLGSIELLSGNLVQYHLDFVGETGPVDLLQRVTGSAMEARHASLPDLDLCVMNPPFVRSAGGSLLFGSIPEAQKRGKMQDRLKALVKNPSTNASITAGLGSVFVALGDKSVKPGGRLALILPKALLSGVSWDATRQLINQKYWLDYVIVSHDAERWNFSDSTDLSEVLIVATKREEIYTPNNHNDHHVTVINLWHNPTMALEALSTATQIMRNTPPDLITGQGAATIILNDKKAGEVITMPWKKMQEDWFLPCAFAQSDLTRTAYYLSNRKLRYPHLDEMFDLPLCPLADLGVLGHNIRDIFDGFEDVDSPTAFRAFWGHASQSVTTIAQDPNRYLNPLSRSRSKRKLKDHREMWQSASHLLLVERMRLNTQRLFAIRLPEPVLSSSWWTLKLNPEAKGENAQKALFLWLNSTLGHITFLVQRETEGAWVKFKKPSLHAMPVLDARALSTDQLNALAAAYDQVCRVELQPLPHMAADTTRAHLDQAVAQALNLPDFAILRTLLAREPVVCMKKLI